MQICTSLQTDNHANTPSLSFYRPDALPATQPTASKHWKHCQFNQSGFKWGKRCWGFGMQWRQLDHMQKICTSRQTDNNTNASSLNFYTLNRRRASSYVIHTHTFNGPFSGTTLCPGLPSWASTRKVKPIGILLKQETVSGSGVSWAICKSAPHSRQITTPAPHQSVFFTGRIPFLPPNQQRQSTEGRLHHTWCCRQ